MNNLLKDVKLNKKDMKASLVWGAVLLIIFTLFRGHPVADLYKLLLSFSDFIVNTFVFLEATLDVLAYIVLLALLTTLAYGIMGVLRAWGNRRRQQNNYC